MYKLNLSYFHTFSAGKSDQIHNLSLTNASDSVEPMIQVHKNDELS